jgi:peptide/nickel transport system substrate-binding protein
MRRTVVLLLALLSSARRPPAQSVTVATTAQPDTLDPHVTSATSAFQSAKSIYDTLVEVARDGVIVPSLASPGPTSLDGLTWTFTLREGVRFHDGTDARRRRRRRVARAAAAEGSPKRDEFAMIADVATPDARTVVLTLVRPAPALLASLASGWGAILPSEKIAAATTSATEPVGTGPSSSRVGARRLPRAHRQPDYFGGAPAIDGVTLRFVPTAPCSSRACARASSTSRSASRRPTSTSCAATPRSCSSRGRRAPSSSPPSTPGALPRRPARAPRAQPRRRRRDDPRGRLRRRRRRRPSWRPAAPGCPTSSSPTATTPSRRARCSRRRRARRLDDRPGAPAALRGPRHRRPDHPGHARDVGVNAEIRVVEWGVWLGEVFGGPRDFDMTVIGHTGKLDPTGRLNGYGTPTAPTRLRQPEVAGWIDRAAVDTDPRRAPSLYAQALTRIHDEAPFVYLGTRSPATRARADVDGFWVTPLLDTYDFRSVTFADAPSPPPGAPRGPGRLRYPCPRPHFVQFLSLARHLAVVLSLVFVAMRALPGDAAAILGGVEASDAQVEACAAQLGLDRPLVAQFGAWWGDVLRATWASRSASGGRSCRSSPTGCRSRWRSPPSPSRSRWSSGSAWGCWPVVARGRVDRRRRPGFTTARPVAARVLVRLPAHPRSSPSGSVGSRSSATRPRAAPACGCGTWCSRR